MNKRDEEEFRTVVAALARAYDASREDVIAAAKALPPSPLMPRGKKPIDDAAALDEAARMRLDGRAASDWAAALAVARSRPGHSPAATATRLFRSMRKGKGRSLLQFYRWYPGAAQIEIQRDVREEPFTRARRAIAALQMLE
jgi:hypothetical protein